MTEKITDYTYEEKQHGLDEAHEIMKSDAEKLSDIKSYVLNCRGKNCSPILQDSEMDLLIGQAERAQEFENLYDEQLEEAQKTYGYFNKENKRFREALEYISSTWRIGLTYQWHVEEFQDKARKALEVSE